MQMKLEQLKQHARNMAVQGHNNFMLGMHNRLRR